VDGRPDEADPQDERHFQIRAAEKGLRHAAIQAARKMSACKILVVKLRGGYLRGILMKGKETVFGRDELEIIGRLKRRPKAVPVLPRDIGHALDIRV
jgi:hypothetical protein